MVVVVDCIMHAGGGRVIQMVAIVIINVGGCVVQVVVTIIIDAGGAGGGGLHRRCWQWLHRPGGGH